MSLMDNNNGMVMPTPRPAYVVQNPNCCGPQTFGCGCGVA